MYRDTILGNSKAFTIAINGAETAETTTGPTKVLGTTPGNW